MSEFQPHDAENLRDLADRLEPTVRTAVVRDLRRIADAIADTIDSQSDLSCHWWRS